MHGYTYTVYMPPQSTVKNSYQESRKTGLLKHINEKAGVKIYTNTTTTTMYAGVQALDGIKITERSLAATLDCKAFPIKINITKTS